MLKKKKSSLLKPTKGLFSSFVFLFQRRRVRGCLLLLI